MAFTGQYLPWVLSVFILLSVLGWYISPLVHWLPAVMVLGFAFVWPFSLPVMLVAGWQKKFLLASFGLLNLLLGIAPALSTYSFAPQQPFPVAHAQGSIRVMQWNTQEMQGNYILDSAMRKERLEAMAFINQYRPHIICMQDFAETTGPYHTPNLTMLADTLGFMHQHIHYHSSSLFIYAKIKQGIAIVSSLPFLRTGALPYPGRIFPEHIVWADVVWQGKPLRIVTTHFRSINLNSHNVFNPTGLPLFQRQDSALIASSDRLRKLQFYQREHAEQAAFLRAFLDTCSVPVLLTADLNTVPASHTYKTVRGNLMDGFPGTATGLGATFNYLAPQLRIDYIFHSSALQKVHFSHFQDGFFDHDHLMGDFRWP